MPLFGARKRACPACGQKSVEVEQGIWVCTSCIANGPISGEQIIDLGLRGNPRRGEFEQYKPARPVVAQLQPQAHDALAPLVQSAEESDRFDEAAFLFFVAFTGSTFDIEDPELEEAAAVYARTLAEDPNLRADDPRFYTLTAVSSSGWYWRQAEEADDAGRVVEATQGWLDRYQRGIAASRSEIIGQTAKAISEIDALEQRLYSEEAIGYASLLGGWFLTHAILLAHQQQLARVHPQERFIDAFRFGVALRDAEVAYDPAAALSLIPAGVEISDEMRRLCDQHGIDFDALYAEARQRLAEEGKIRFVDQTLARRVCRIMVAAAAGLIADDVETPLDAAGRALYAAQETGNEQMVETATAHYDSELVKMIDEAGLGPLVEALEGMITAENLGEAQHG